MCLKNYRHIITKAVIGHGKKKLDCKTSIALPQRPNRILGCWIVNHQYQAKKLPDGVELVGQYEVNIWYAFGGSKKTAVHAESIHYKGTVPIHYDSKPVSRDDVYIKSIDEPECERVKIEENGKVCVETVHCVHVEVIGETSICVETFQRQEPDESSSPFYGT
ncbi:spore coat protein [Chryseomicrobium excrementi]|uniref:Spore coat protein n=1 Tax=Chryseomicrobium excrementi TaxID=2041346 RepID=A0A2M9F2Z3_9BACL|nr:spore coat protein [Chryseomicrobium excrementi]